MARDWKGGSASTFKTIGASNHCEHERADKDYYATEPAATDWLCRIEQFGGPILEPSCGEGHISRQLMAAGYEVVSRDLADRGFGEVADFLAAENTAWDGDIVTNPPYAFAQEFVEKALAIIPDGRKVAIPEADMPGREEAGRAFPKLPTPEGVGEQGAIEMCHERRLREHGRLGHGLRLVCVGEGISGSARDILV